MRETAQIIEMDQDRDRKTCVALDLKVSGANRELAQWLLDHPRYPATVVAGWLGCESNRIKRLRVWAKEGFEGNPSDKSHACRSPAIDAPLKTKDNFETETEAEPEPAEAQEVADPAQVEDNALHTLARMGEHARVFKKIFKLSAFDREAESRIITAIDRMIEKWRLTQSTLTRRSRCND